MAQIVGCVPAIKAIRRRAALKPQVVECASCTGDHTTSILRQKAVRLGSNRGLCVRNHSGLGASGLKLQVRPYARPGNCKPIQVELDARFRNCKTLRSKIATARCFSNFMLDYRLKVRVSGLFCRNMAHKYELFLQQFVLKSHILARNRKKLH